MARGDWIAASLGVVIALAVVGYPFVYVPMSANYAECGKLSICKPWPTNR